MNQATNSGPSQTQQQQTQVRGLEPVTTAAAATAQLQQQPARGMEQINSHYQQQQQVKLITFFRSYFKKLAKRLKYFFLH